MIELHAHTTVSDGGDSPAELIRHAAEVGVSAIAVTDHDNDSGCAEAEEAGRALGVEVIRGVEISCDVDSLGARGFTPKDRPTMHLLGYFVPPGPNPLSDALAELQELRANRNALMVERLNELGVDVTFEEVEAEAGGPGAQIGRPHFAAALVRHGVVPDFQTAFDEYLAKGAKAYIGRRLYDPVHAVKLMVEAGVVPVLAHPFTLHLDQSDLERFVGELAGAGLRGIEGYHGDRSEEEQEPCRELGRALGLIITGGSDYHGNMVPDRLMPGGKNNVLVPDDVLEQLRAAAGSPSTARP